MVGRLLGGEQRRAVDQALRVLLAHLAFGVVGRPEVIGPAGTKTTGRWPNCSSADHQARHDLVADAQAQHAVEHVVRQRHRGRHRDHVAREQRQLHALGALGDAVAHRRHAAGDLRRGAEPACGGADRAGYCS